MKIIVAPFLVLLVACNVSIRVNSDQDSELIEGAWQLTMSEVITPDGQYEATDGVLTIRPEFAMIPEYIGGIGVFDYELNRDSLDLVWHTIEAVDGTPDPNTALGVRFHYRFSRLKER